MYCTMTATEVIITCTFLELADMDLRESQVYAVPDGDGNARQIYLARSHQYRDDFLLATIDDFCHAQGWTTLGWIEMTDAEFAAAIEDKYTVIMPRQRPPAEDDLTENDIASGAWRPLRPEER